MIKKAKALEINIGLLPLEFELTSNADDPDPDGKFTLSWSESEYATKYVVYQGDVKIAEDITTLKYQITDLETGEYTFS
ncbi:MAG: hypothetical protein ACOC44_20715, partial [Promethearchaeia archaeon]